MATPRIICFEPDGPASTGLQEWEPIDPTGLQAGEPVQRGHIYHQDEAAGYMAGVWDCTPMTGRFARSTRPLSRQSPRACGQLRLWCRFDWIGSDLRA